MSLPGNSPTGAQVVVWERPGFKFPHPCDLLVDAGIFIARFDTQDGWHRQVKNLFDNHILLPPGSLIPGMWVNPYVVGEYVGRVMRQALAAGAPCGRSHCLNHSGSH